MRHSLRSWACLSACALLAATGCGGGADDEDVVTAVPVQVRDVETGDVEDVVVATGTLRSSVAASVTVDTAGIVTIAKTAAGRRLQVGDRVSAGQLLATLSGDEVRVTARTDATQRRFETARRDYETKKRLHEEGLVAELELQSAEAALAEAEAEYERSRLTETRSRITTPIAGVLLKLATDERGRPIADGQRVPAGFALAEIAPTASLVADVDLIGADALRVKPGLPARVRHYAWGDLRFEGRVARLAPSFDPVTRSFRAEVAVRNPDRQLRPGMFVEAAIVIEERKGVPVVPREAVTERGGRSVVFVAEGQRASQREVELGLGDDDVVEVLSGVAEGEDLVVRGHETLTDETLIRASGL